MKLSVWGVVEPRKDPETTRVLTTMPPSWLQRAQYLRHELALDFGTRDRGGAPAVCVINVSTWKPQENRLLRPATLICTLTVISRVTFCRLLMTTSLSCCLNA